MFFCQSWRVGLAPPLDHEPCRKLVTEKDDQVKEKEFKRTRSMEELEDKLVGIQQTGGQAEKNLEMWSRVLNAILVPNENHGAQKPEDTPWRNWFESAIGEPIPDCPIGFHDGKLTFPDAIVHLSTHIALLRKEVEAATSKQKNIANRLEKKKASHTRLINRGKRRLEKIIELKESGTYKEYKEDKKYFGGGN